MRKEPPLPLELPRIPIRAGEYYVTGEPVLISTLLGSCVSACIYDPRAKIVGMNHFLLSSRRYSRDLPLTVTEAGRYGVHAMELVINEMLKLGAKRPRLQAKAFGGASLLQSSRPTDNFFCVGEVNARFIREFLKNEGIPLVSEDLGGDQGRVILFHSDDFSVYVRKVRKTINAGLATKEKQFWEKSILDHEKETEGIRPDIWL